MSLAGDSLYLAWCYLRLHRMKTLILVAAIATISFLPVGLNVLVAKSGEELMARAESTPLLIGALLRIRSTTARTSWRGRSDPGDWACRAHPPPHPFSGS